MDTLPPANNIPATYSRFEVQSPLEGSPVTTSIPPSTAGTLNATQSALLKLSQTDEPIEDKTYEVFSN